MCIVSDILWLKTKIGVPLLLVDWGCLTSKYNNQYTKIVSYSDFPLLGLIEDTLWLFNIAMEIGPFIDDLPITNGDFPWQC